MEGIMVLGGFLIFTSVAGKTGVRFYRQVKAGTAFQAKTQIGKYYAGGFEPTMNSREASLILGVRESSDANKIM